MSASLQLKPKSSGGRSASPGGMTTVLMLILGLPFVAIGVGVVLYAMSTVVKFEALKRWEETPAKILSAELQSHRGSKGSTTYSVNVSYEYDWRGETHRGTRVRLLDSVSDSSGGWQRRAVAEYREAQSRGRNVPCYVNPAKPEEAILKREMPWGAWAGMMVFGLIFGGAGVAVLGGLVIMWRKAREEAALRAQWPGEPWRWEKSWAEGRIISSTKSGAMMLTGFALFWNAIGWLPVILGYEELFAKKNPVMLLVLLFPLVGIVLVVVAVRAWCAWLRFGDAVFRMTEMPGVIGGTLSGTICSPCRRQPSADVKLSLVCTQTVRAGKNSSTYIVWQEARNLRQDAIHATPDGMVVPVLFQIPFDCLPTEREAGIAWRLELKGDFGGSVSARFDVPIFKTAASDPDFKPDTGLEARYFAAPAPGEILKASRVTITALPAGGRRYVFHANRALGLVLPLTLFAIIWTAITAGLWYWSGPQMLKTIFTMIDLLVLWGVADMWLWSGRAEVSPQGVAVAGGRLFKGAVKRFDAGEVARFALDSGLMVGNHVYYNLRLETRDGKKITLAKRLPERAHGEWLIAEMERDLGRSCEPAAVAAGFPSGK